MVNHLEYILIELNIDLNIFINLKIQKIYILKIVIFAF